MNKKLLLVSSLFLVGVTTPLMASCNKNSEPVTPEVTTSIEFDTTVKDLIVGDTCLMKAKVKNPDGTSEVVYSSSNPEVATIDEFGYVNALKSGTTEIRATYSKYAAKCTINVSRGEFTPTIILENIKKEEVTTSVGASLDVSAKIFFNQHEYDFTPTYSLTDSSIGKVENNVFTASKVGTTVLTVSGKFDGVDATPISLKINVNENIVISMKEEGEPETSSVTLFTLPSYQGESFKQSFTPTFVVYVDGKPVTAKLDVKCETKGLVEFSRSTNKVTVVSNNPQSGETSYEVTYKDAKGNEYKKYFPIYVNRPVVDYVGSYDTDKYNSDLNASVVFSGFSNKTLMKVTSEDGKTEYPVNQSTHRVTELPSSRTEAERVAAQKFIIYNTVIGFKVTVRVYDKIVRTFEDLKFFNFSSTSKILDGDYFLANNIDGKGQTLTEHVRTMGEGYSSWGEVGFRGVFDGRGHTLTNFTVREGGIFGNLGNGAVIKNLAITNVSFDVSKGDDTAIIAPYFNGATLENVYVHNSKLGDRWNPGLVASNIMSNCVLSHCLFVLDMEVPTQKSFGCLANMCGERKSIFSYDIFNETYLVSKLYATYDIRKDGGAEEYVVDAAGFYDGPLTSYKYKNLNHDKTIEDMKKKEYDFSSFNNYWEVVNHELRWKGA